MDIISVIFLVCGWVFAIKGLVITSTVLGGVGIFFCVVLSCIYANEKKASKVTDLASMLKVERIEKNTKRNYISMFIYSVILAVSIVKLCIGF